MLPESGSAGDQGSRLPRRRRWSSDPGVFSAVVAPRRRLRLGATFSSRRGASHRPSHVDGSWFRASAVVLVAAVLTAGCSAASTGTQRSAPAAAAGDPVRLAGVCPGRIVVQGGWYPTADIALPFQLLGADWKVDATRKRLSGSLVADGRDTGVDVEFRSGGPATGFQTGPAVAYTDRAVTLAFTNLDEMIGVSAKLPMQAVIAPLNGEPQVLIWDPVTYPTFGSVQDIGQTDTRVVYSANASTVFGYLTGTGILRASQLDASYDGSPSRFVAARGKVVVQGYATNEPHLYEALPAWGRPVRYALIQDTGYPNYAGMLAVRTGDRGRLDGCLRRLVPILQRAQVAFLADPGPALDRIVRAVAAFRAGFSYDRATAEYGACQLAGLGLVSNPIDGVAGSVDVSKVRRMLAITTPVLTANRTPPRPGLTPTDLVTTDYLDRGLSLPARPALRGIRCTRTPTD